MKKAILFLLAASFIIGCSSKEPIKKDFQTADEILSKLDNLNQNLDTLPAVQNKKVNTYIIKNPATSEALRTQPKIMETLFLGYIDSSNNQVSDYFVSTVIEEGKWVNKTEKQKDNKHLGSINE
jgi:hypothetical protein